MSDATAASPDTGEVPRKGRHLLERDMEVVDLTREIYQGMPIWQYHQRPFIMVNHTHQEAVERFGVELPFEAHNLLMSEHTGTHTDAIYEYDPNGPTLDRSPLAFYYGSAVCLDVSHVRHPDYLTAEVLEAAEAASETKVQEGDIVLLFTGHGDRTFPSDDYLSDYTGVSRDGALWLADRGVVNIGIDAVSIDHSDDPHFSGHVVCREYQIVNTESLCNLDRLAGRRFLYMGLPLNIRGGTGSPIRAVAVLDR
jgi:kynurenine formamidase